MTISFENPEPGEPRSSADGKVRTALVRLKEAMTTQEAIKHPVTWYTPKVISTEESRTNTAYGTLTTPDEVTEVVVPENGLIMVGYQATWKESVKEAARAAIFLGSNQLKVALTNSGSLATQAAATGSTATVDRKVALASTAMGLVSGTTGSAYAGDATTGQAVGLVGGTGTSALVMELAGFVDSISTSGSNITPFGGLCYIFAGAGTYTVSVKYKASSGSVTASNRKLWVGVLSG